MLVECWAEHLGRHQVPVDEQAQDIKALMSPDAVHHDLIHEVVRNVYCANRCGHLDAPITLDATFTALGLVQQALLAAKGADVDQMKLLDDIGWSTRCYFNATLEGQTAPRPEAEVMETGAAISDFRPAASNRL